MLFDNGESDVESMKKLVKILKFMIYIKRNFNLKKKIEFIL